MTKWQRVACWISKGTRMQAHAHTRAPTTTHMHAQALTHARAHAHTPICIPPPHSISGFVNAPEC